MGRQGWEFESKEDLEDAFDCLQDSISDGEEAKNLVDKLNKFASGKHFTAGMNGNEFYLRTTKEALGERTVQEALQKFFRSR